MTNLLPFMAMVIEESAKELKRTEEEAHGLEQHIATLNLPDGEYE